MRWVQLCSSLSILLHCLSLELERKLTFSSSVATAEYSKFAGILSAALSLHHLQNLKQCAGALKRRWLPDGPLKCRWLPAGALKHRRLPASAERSYPTFEVRGSGLVCQAAMAQERSRGATLRPRSGAAARRSYPASEVGVVAERSYPASEFSGGREETPCV